jgi:hypothetical protein
MVMRDGWVMVAVRPGRRELASLSTSAARSVIEDRARLRQRDAGEPLDELVHGRVVFQVIEQCGDWDPSAAEHPGPAHAAGVALDGWAG